MILTAIAAKMKRGAKAEHARARLRPEVWFQNAQSAIGLA